MTSVRQLARDLNDPAGVSQPAVGQEESKAPAVPVQGTRARRRRRRLGPWLERNCWRLGPGFAVVAAVWWWRLPGVAPWGDLWRGVVNWAGSHAGQVPGLGGWWPEPGPSRFDACWSGAGGVCWPGWGAVREAGGLFAVGAAVVVVWWRLSEFPAGPGRVGQWFTDRRRFRVLLHLAQQWDETLRRLGLLQDGRPVARLCRLRVDMSGAVVGEFRLASLGNFGVLARQKDDGSYTPTVRLTQVRTELSFTTGYRRRFQSFPGWARPVGWVLAFVLGDARYKLWPAAVVPTDDHDRGGRYRNVRIVFPTLDAELIPADVEPAPSDHEVRLAVGRDVVLWDRSAHPHAAGYGPTNRGKGHVMRRVDSQVLQGHVVSPGEWAAESARDGGEPLPVGTQVPELVVKIDGQMGPEHAVWAGLANYWWFDPRSVPKGTVPGWARDCLTAAQLAEVDRDVPRERYIEVAHLVYVRNQLRSVLALGVPRGDLVRDAEVGGWRELGARTRKKHPRINVHVDELNGLLMKGVGPGRVGEELRREIGALLGAILFQGSKYGISCFLAAQIMYAKAYLADGAYAQVGRAVWLGNAPPQHQKMVSAVSDWPKVPDRAGDGVEFAYAAGRVQACRFPFFPIQVARQVRRRIDDLTGGAP